MCTDAPASIVIEPRRWWALIALCLGVLMIVLNSTIVNITLPFIRQDLGLTDVGAVWIVNAYLLTFSGFFLLAGRMSDLYGRRRLLLIGNALFTAASLACGLGRTPALLIAARAAQGLGGALVAASALALIMELFSAGEQRAKAIGVYGFASYGGGVFGVLLGGILTSALSWHWTFFINLPIGLLVHRLCSWLLPRTDPERSARSLDIWGALFSTACVALAILGLVNGNIAGWMSPQTLAPLAAAALLLAAFVVRQICAADPLAAPQLFRLRSFNVALIISVLWGAAVRTWFVTAPLYMQEILAYSPLQLALAFLPAHVAMATFSFGPSAALVKRFGAATCLIAGAMSGALGLALLVRVPLNGQFIPDLLAPMLLLGIGIAIVLNPVLLVAASDVEQRNSGVAMAIVNVAGIMGGAFGIALATSVAAARQNELLTSGSAHLLALYAGHRMAFSVEAAYALLASIAAAALLRGRAWSENARNSRVASAPGPPSGS